MREFNRTLMIRSWQLHQLLANRTAVRYSMADTEKDQSVRFTSGHDAVSNSITAECRHDNHFRWLNHVTASFKLSIGGCTHSAHQKHVWFVSQTEPERPQNLYSLNQINRNRTN